MQVARPDREIRHEVLGSQAAEALTQIQPLATEATSQGRDAVDPAAPTAQTHLFHSAALIGARRSAGRSGALMKSTTPWPAACSTAKTTTCGSPRTSARHRTITEPSATYGWPN